ncbi:MAG: filamentous hemagglutinin N-terminal domain-containing protein [Cyanobacteria bacterium P01_F01_bin.143]
MRTIRNLLLLLLSIKSKNQSFILSLIIFSTIGIISPTSAQIVPDATLPSNSLAIPDASGNLIDITGGTTSGNNLFHSFQEFSVLNGQTASFNNGLTIENILTRVTGNSISNIDGLIEANGTANLFLINPNGIIFGENASLDIGGSFLGSTADSIQFSDGSLYSAVNPQTPPLLEINIPIGLQYGANAGNIIVSGRGNSTGFTDPSVNNYALIKDFRPAGLQVSQGKSLALIGGNIALDGGNLTAASGHIELGSVTEGLVKLDSETWAFDYQDVAGFKDIALVNAASVEVSGNSSGTVKVQGQNITLSDASAILSNTSGDGTAGSITLNGEESVQVTGVSQNNIPFVSYVSTGTTPGSAGVGADLNINTDYLLVAGGAQVDAPVFGSGDGGTLTVNAEQVELIAGSPVAGSSGLFAPVIPGATGKGGDINVDTDSLLVAGGAQLFAFSVSSAPGGDINIDAQEIELNGTSPNGTPSGLFTNAFADGDSGNITIETDNLLLQDGGDINSAVLGAARSGDINIDAETIVLNSSTSSIEDSSSISTIVNAGATGFSGDITIETSSLIMSDGTQIASDIFGSGEGGNIAIVANEIDLTGFSSVESLPTGLFATLYPGATGNAGSIDISTNNLQVSEGAQIAVATGGFGDGGILKISASDSIEINGNAIEEIGVASGLFSSAVVADGNGGSIEIQTNKLTLNSGATINASNFLSGNRDVPPGTGRAGDISINASTIAIDGIDADTPASITAATIDGGGGNIALESNSISVTNGGLVTTETSGAGDGGEIVITSDRLELNNTGTLSSSTVGTGDAGTVSVTSNLLKMSTEGTITTSSIGKAGQAGEINLSITEIQADQGFITATSELTGGGDISFETTSIFLDNQSLISTSVLDSNGGGGNITIDNSNLILARDNSDIRANAIFGPGGNIDITSELLVTDSTSDIDASSRFGTDGVVEIRSPNSEEELAKAVLPSNLVDTRNLLISSSCPVSDENSFAVIGNGGLPQSPYQPHSLATTWNDLRSVNEEIEQVTSLPKFLQEATNIVVNSEGNLELVALAPLSTGNWVQSSCSK